MDLFSCRVEGHEEEDQFHVTAWTPQLSTNLPTTLHSGGAVALRAVLRPASWLPAIAIDAKVHAFIGSVFSKESL